jgi:hypothetical protein
MGNEDRKGMYSGRPILATVSDKVGYSNTIG